MIARKLLVCAALSFFCCASYSEGVPIDLLDPIGPGLGGSGDTYVAPKTYTYNYNELNNVETNIPTLTTDLLGDKIDPATGSLSFSHTDVSIPGNFDINVAISRSLSDPLNWYKATRDIGNWSIEIPHVRSNYVTSLDGSYTGAQYGAKPAWATNKACSSSLNNNPNFLKSFFPKVGGNTPISYSLTKSDYWSGDTVSIPGVGSGKLLQYGSTKKTTNNWRVKCVTVSGVNSFEVTIPNGTKYIFSHLKKVNSLKKIYMGAQPSLLSGQGAAPNPPIDSELGRGPERDNRTGMQNVQVFMQVTTITDRFGNWVKYDYDTAGNLDKIRASDGRLIDVSFSGGRLTTVNANGRVWRYYYDSPTSSSSFYKLAEVKRPDNQSWKFDYLGTYWANSLIGEMTPINASTPTSCFALGGGPFVELTHPNGAVGKFTIAERCMGQARVPKIEVFNKYGQGRAYQNYELPIVSKQYAISGKTISFNDGTDYTWEYEYGRLEGYFYDDPLPNANHLMLFKFSSSADISFIDHNIADLNSTLEIGPDGSYYLSLFDRRYGYSNGNKLYTAIYNKDLALVSYSSHKYATSPTIYGDSRNWTISTYPAFIIAVPPEFSGQASFDQGISSTRVQRSIESKFSLLNGTLPTHYSEKFSVFNTYEKPTVINQAGPSGTKTITLGYTSNESQWILDQPTTVDLRLNSGSIKRLSEKTYHSKSASSLAYRFNLKEDKWFGATRKSYPTYHTATGMIGQIKDIDQHKNTNGDKRRVTFSNYKRGKAQTITVPKRYTSGTMAMSKSVDNNGWVLSTTDFNGATTGYKYDSLGLVKAVNFQADPVYGNWEDLYFNYSYPSSGGLVRTQYQCIVNSSMTGCSSSSSLTTTETYDELLRLKKTKASGSGINRYQLFEYDSNNKKTFQSFSSSNANESRGVRSVYDALQRLEKTITSGLGTTSITYLAGNKVQTTDARNNKTTATYRAFSSPSYQLATEIKSPENVTTKTAYDMFGNVESITQSGNGLTQTENRYYDNYNNLCLIKRKDIGNTRTSFNLLGELNWSARGAVSSCSSSKPSYTVDFSYDNLGSNHRVLFSDSSPEQTYALDNNGNLLTLTAGSVTSEYTYNNLNMLELESIKTPTRAKLSVNYVYNQQKQISSIIYPNNHRVYTYPNAFGQSTKVHRSGRTYLSNGSYHANGMVKSYISGNGVAHLTSLNSANDLPNEMKYYKGSSVVAKFNYLYDANGNITRILDGVDTGYSINTMQYDGLDRLTRIYANSKRGNTTLSYDTLGNIEYYANKNRALNYHYDRTNNLLDSVTSSGAKDKDYSYFNYDDRGNITHNSHFAMSYNLADQMVAANGNSYLYDGHNKRVYENEKGAESYSFYSKSGSLLYREEQGVGTNYIYLANKLIAEDKGGTVTYLHTDNLGSPVAQTNAAGSVKKRMHYFAFGESIETQSDDVGYTGHKFDADTGLSYMQARYYDPVIGRFYSNDPVGYSSENPVMSFNRYMYVNNNPYKYTDPNGEFLNFVFGAAAGIAAEVITKKLTGQEVSLKGVLVAGALGALTSGASAGSIAAISAGAGLKETAKAAIKGALGPKPAGTVSQKIIKTKLVAQAGLATGTVAGFVVDASSNRTEEKSSQSEENTVNNEQENTSTEDELQ